MRRGQTRESPGGVKVEKARVENAHYPEVPELGDDFERGQISLGTGHQDRVTDEHAQRPGQFFPDQDGVGVGKGLAEAFERTFLQALQQVSDAHFAGRVHTLQHNPLGARVARDKDLLVDRGSCRHNMREAGKFFRQIVVVPDAVVCRAQQVDVRSSA